MVRNYHVSMVDRQSKEVSFKKRRIRKKKKENLLTIITFDLNKIVILIRNK